MTTIDFAAMYKRASKEAKKSKQASSVDEGSNISPISCVQLLNSESLLFANAVLAPDHYLRLIDTIRQIQKDWNFVNGREVMLFGGVPHPQGAILENLPGWLSSIAVALKPYFGGSVPNQVLLNKYACGEGISYHCDGPLYDSVAAILSLSSSAIIQFCPIARTDSTGHDTCHPDSSVLSVFLPANSLFVFKNEFYCDYNHSVPASPIDLLSEMCANMEECGLLPGQSVNRSEYRYSLTFRLVMSVATKLEEFGPCNAEMQEEIARRKAWWLQSISDEVS